MRISALDLGAQTGICTGEPGKAPTFETWRLEGLREDRGLTLMRRLSEHLDAALPDAVYIEAAPPLAGMMRKGTNIEALQNLYGYEMIARVVVRARGVKLGAPVDVQKARRHFLGMRPAKGEGKDRVMHRCQVLGWKPMNNNEADAACIWEFGCALESPAVAIRERLKQAVLLS